MTTPPLSGQHDPTTPIGPTVEPSGPGWRAWGWRLGVLALVAAIVAGIALAGGFRTRTDHWQMIDPATSHQVGPLEVAWNAPAIARGSAARGWKVTMSGTCTNTSDQVWRTPFNSEQSPWIAGSPDHASDPAVGQARPAWLGGEGAFLPHVTTHCVVEFKHPADWVPPSRYEVHEGWMEYVENDLMGYGGPEWELLPNGKNWVFHLPLVVEPAE